MVKLASNSEVRLFKTCRRAWYLTYFRRLHRRRKVVTGPAYTGTRVHAALQGYYDNPGPKGKLHAYAILKGMTDDDLARVPEDAVLIGKESELARIIVEGYFDWIEETGADAHLEVIETEHKIITRSPVEEVDLIAKLDLSVLNTATGDTGFLDHKVVQNLTDPIKILNLDEQFRHYALMHRLAHPDEALPRRFSLYNMLRKVKRSKTATPPFYARQDVYVNDLDLASFWNRLYGEISDILRVERQLAEGADHRTVAYPMPTRDCSWRCEFFTVCPMFDDAASDPEHMLAEHYEVYDPLERYEEAAVDGPSVDSVV